MSDTDIPRGRQVAKPIPRSVEDWIRKTEFHRTLNDQVEDIHLRLVDDEEYLAYLDAVYDEQAVEGSLAADNVMAAKKIREAALAMTPPNTKLAKEKLATISKALGVVLRRYHQSRTERRVTVGGEAVPSENGNN
jgi:hypothetical protein